jgi:carbon-monoxide dehydrogenase large subunit
MPMGQGIETVLAQVAADELRIEIGEVSVVYGDTLAIPYTGYGSGGSRGAGVAGSAVLAAASQLREHLRRIAAHRLEVRTVQDAEGGGFTDGTGHTCTLAEVASAAYSAIDLPPGLEPGLEASFTYDPKAFAFSYGTVAAVVEIDRETGSITISRLVFGHDCGPQLHPGNVEGQVVGGIAQGIGTALYEHLPYAADGHPVVKSMWDYFPPLAGNVPPVELLHLETPSPFSLNGAKGVGESGTIPIPAVLANAIRDALDNTDTVVDTVPITAERVLASLDRASKARDRGEPL